jgi:hypothetical protein
MSPSFTMNKKYILHTNTHNMHFVCLCFSPVPRGSFSTYSINRPNSF